ncbi:MAG: cobalamin-binding protein [Candidatus Aenigmarchaeota archaeon]|nr:cobalamin-binding protein [Candidatus Aenigmarchaeota archaeon]
MRIVSLAPSNTEILYAIGAGDQIVGVTTFCDYPPEAKAKQKVGGWTNVDYDAIRALAPDVVITSTSVQDVAAQKCREMGFNVLHIDPKNLSEVFDSVHRLGQLVGMQSGAELVVQMMRLKIDEVVKRVEGGSMRPRVYAEEWHKPPFVCGNWIPELIQLAGGESLINEGRSREVALDEVKAFDPHYMIVTWCGFGERAQAELIKYREGWEDVYAVKNGRIFVFDDSYLNRPGPRLVDGLELLARTIHPEMFS